MPDFPDEAGFIFCPVQNLEEEVISDDEDHHSALSKYSSTSDAKKFHKDTNLHSFGSGEDGAYVRSMVNEEADVLVHLKKKCFIFLSCLYQSKQIW
uniref:Uncharacterized protein n=1 Tax=Rhizophora mucronata TaxID=61149 RepID=A0A2P2IVW6_RHIMU